MVLCRAILNCVSSRLFFFLSSFSSTFQWLQNIVGVNCYTNFKHNLLYIRFPIWLLGKSKLFSRVILDQIAFPWLYLSNTFQYVNIFQYVSNFILFYLTLKAEHVARRALNILRFSPKVHGYQATWKIEEYAVSFCPVDKSLSKSFNLCKDLSIWSRTCEYAYSKQKACSKIFITVRRKVYFALWIRLILCRIKLYSLWANGSGNGS